MKSSSLKIRAFLSPPKSVKKVSPPPSVSSPTSSSSSPFSSVTHSGSSFRSKSSRCPAPVASRCHRSRIPAAAAPPYGYQQSHGNRAASGGHAFLVYSGNHWQ